MTHEPEHPRDMERRLAREARAAEEAARAVPQRDRVEDPTGATARWHAALQELWKDGDVWTAS